MKKYILLLIVTMMTFCNVVCFADNSSNENYYEDTEEDSEISTYIELECSDIKENAIILNCNDSKNINIKTYIVADNIKSPIEIPVVFSMSDSNLATIDENGLITTFKNTGVAELYIVTSTTYKKIPIVINNSNDFDVNLFIAENFLRNSEIMIGDENGNFNAENAMTRAEFAKIVCKFTNREQAYKGYGCDYTDVATDFWGYNYIMNATQAGYLRGYGNRVFGVNDTLTEEQAITVLCRMLGDTYEDVSYIETSVDENGGYSEGYISIAGKRGIDIEGLQKTVPATRARVAKWLYQLYNIKNNF